MKYTSDFLVIGSGIAGLTFALKAANIGTVSIVTKKRETDSNTNYAQGGIASVMDQADTFESHIEDTLVAGAGLCNEEAVKCIVEYGPEAIQQLVEWGVQFTKQDKNTLSLAKEGGHSSHRIVHSKDLTGRAIETALISAVKKHPNITLFPNHFAIDFITEHHTEKEYSQENQTCFGAYVFNSKEKRVNTFISQHTLLCSGGAGQVYLHTTNPSIATGDGIAMAYRAGCKIENMEFIQFHPTALYDPHKTTETSFLISEAVRGFGGILRNHQHHAFMKTYDSREDLAPRDIVARAIDAEMKKHNIPFVWLDLTHKHTKDIISHFPNIYKTCLAHKIDITKEMIPVVPSAHYSCGGVKTDLNGKTDIHNLYACGEVASTGVHGANRLASNSLLEAVVFANRAINAIQKHTKILPDHSHIPLWDDSRTYNHEEWGIIHHDRLVIQQIMWDLVGIVRSTFRLKRALRRLNTIYIELEEYYKTSAIFPELLELRNMATTAYLIVRCALLRKESRGLHYTIDFPEKNTGSITHSIIRSSRFTK